MTTYRVEEYTASHMSDKGIVFRICKNHNSWKTNQSRSGQKSWIPIFPKKIYKWPTGTWKWHSASLVIAVLCCAHSLGRVWHIMTPWTVAHQAPLSMGFPKQECWSGLPFPTPGDIPDLQPKSPRSPAVAVGFFTTMPPGNQLVIQFSSVQLLSRVLLFATPWIVARQASLSITNSQSSPRLTSLEKWKLKS